MGMKRTLRRRDEGVTRAVLAMMAAAMLGTALPVAAQTAPTREEILREPIRSDVPRRAEIDGSAEIERAPCPLANPELASIRFTLQSVDFTNAGAIDPALLAPAWTGEVGRDLPLSAICDIRDRASAILDEAGYLSAVRVPVQTIRDGRVTLDILAARLVGIQVRGDAGANEAQLARYLSRLEGQPLFNRFSAERYLLLANSMPGMAARLTLRPAGAPGEVIGEVTVARTPVFVDASIQNFGGNPVGRWGGIARIRVNGITGLGDETTIGAYATHDFEEQRVIQGAHEFRVGGDGLTFGTNATYAWTRPTLPGNLDLRSETLVWSTWARYPLALSQSRAIWAGGGFDWIDQDIRVAGVAINRDRLRIAFAKVEANWIDPEALTGRGDYSPAEPRWSANLLVEARQGIAGLGASPRCITNAAACFGPGKVPTTRDEGDPAATVIRASGEFVWRPAPLFSIALMPRAQWASGPLLAFEEYAAGNFTVGRGYDPGTVSGDSAVGGGIELRLGSLIPPNPRDIAIQPFAFFDAAWIWNDDTAFAGLGAEEVYSAGGGARIAIGQTARLDLYAARPLRKTLFETRRSDLRFLVSFTTQFGLGR